MHRSSAQPVSFVQRSVRLLSTLAGYGVLAAALFVAPAVRADIIQTFNLAWSGASFGNAASATGSITLDETLVGKGTDEFSVPSAAITGLSVTVTGAGPGNGTFGIADFGEVVMYINGGSFDFTKQLVGQTASGGGWGTNSSAGDFNLFFNGVAANAPDGYNVFDLAADGDNSAYQMQLTSFAPVTAVPEPSSVALLGLGVLGVGFLARRRRAI